MTNLYKKLDLLKLTDIYKFELAKIMHHFYDNKLPEFLLALFTRIDIVTTFAQYHTYTYTIQYHTIPYRFEKKTFFKPPMLQILWQANFTP